MSALTWNTDKTLILPGKYQSDISVGWKNYNDSGVWQAIDTDMPSDRTVTSFPGSVSFPFKSQGTISAVFDHNFSIKRKIDENNSDNSEPELEMEIEVLTDHNVIGEQSENSWERLYKNAWDNTHLRLGVRLGRAARIEKIIEIHSAPPGSDDLQYSFKIRSSQAKIFVGPNFDVRPWAGSIGDQATISGAPVFVARGDSQIRGALLRTPKCWWFENGEKVEHNITVTFVVQSDQETVIGTKHIPRTYVNQALAAGSSLFTDVTFTPDANPETNSVDGRVDRFDSSPASWAAHRAGAGTNHADSSSFSELSISFDATQVPVDLKRFICGFDTSSIGAGQQVDSATLAITFYNQGNAANIGSNFAMAITGATPASNSDLVDADYSQTGSTEMATSRVAHGTTSKETWTLNGDGEANIDMIGTSFFALREGYYDLDGNDPTGVGTASEYTRQLFRTAEYSGTTDDPTLTVTHSAAGAAVAILNHHYSRQRAR